MAAPKKITILFGVFFLVNFQISSAMAFCNKERSLTSLSDVTDLIDHCHITTIEDFIEALSPLALQKYLLVYDSRSSQMASPDYPRIILYGAGARKSHPIGPWNFGPSDETATLTFGISGTPYDPKYNELEFFQFNHSSKAFEFYKLTFNSQGNKPPTLSQKNPKECLTCHGQDPRPNFDNYPFWPGVFGSDDPISRTAKNDIGVWYSEEETSFAQRYLKNRDQGRYQHLGVENDSGYLSRLGLTEASTNTNATEFLAAVSGDNMERAARILKQTPSVWPYRYALLANESCVGRPNSPYLNIESFLPANFSPKYNYANALSNSCNAENTSYQYDFNRQFQLLGVLPDPSGRIGPLANLSCDLMPGIKEGAFSQTAGLLFVIQNAGLDPEDFPLEVDRQFLMNDGLGGFDTGLELVLWKYFLNPITDYDLYAYYSEAFARIKENENDPGLPLEPIDLNPRQDTFCSILQKKSLQALANTR
jgi:hypothetical protein